jgi:hypothetical protein
MHTSHKATARIGSHIWPGKTIRDASTLLSLTLLIQKPSSSQLRIRGFRSVIISHPFPRGDSMRECSSNRGESQQQKFPASVSEASGASLLSFSSFSEARERSKESLSESERCDASPALAAENGSRMPRALLAVF